MVRIGVEGKCVLLNVCESNGETLSAFYQAYTCIHSGFVDSADCELESAQGSSAFKISDYMYNILRPQILSLKIITAVSVVCKHVTV